jgi:hypothetical protein
MNAGGDECVDITRGTEEVPNTNTRHRVVNQPSFEWFRITYSSRRASAENRPEW